MPKTTNNPNDPDDDCRDSNDDDNSDGKDNPKAEKDIIVTHNQTEDYRHHDGYNTLDINGLMKAYVGKQQLSGEYDEYLDDCFQVFETVASMCQVTEEEMGRALPIMLRGDAFSLYSAKVDAFPTYKDAKRILRS